jgi:putative FmdB family regulatory protein
MPTYEYACKSCGEHLEVVQSFRDEPLRECPACSGQLRKVFSPVGISFKGSGFYRNDSRTSAKTGKGDGRDKAEATSSASESSDGKGADAKGTDSKTTESKGTESKGSGSKADQTHDSGKKDAPPKAKSA